MMDLYINVYSIKKEDVKKIYPKLMKDITEKEAILDGFSNLLDCQKKLLEIEGIAFKENDSIDLNTFLWRISS